MTAKENEGENQKFTGATEVFSESCQTSKMKSFAKIVHG